MTFEELTREEKRVIDCMRLRKQLDALILHYTLGGQDSDSGEFRYPTIADMALPGEGEDSHAKTQSRKERINMDTQDGQDYHLMTGTVGAACRPKSPLTRGDKGVCKTVGAASRRDKTTQVVPVPKPGARVCAICGADISDRARNAKYCAACAKQADVACTAKWKERNAAENPVEPRACLDCGKLLTDRARNARRCADCAAKHHKETAPERVRGKYKPAAPHICIDCGIEIVGRGTNAKRCAECADKKCDADNVRKAAAWRNKKESGRSGQGGQKTVGAASRRGPSTPPTKSTQSKAKTAVAQRVPLTSVVSPGYRGESFEMNGTMIYPGAAVSQE